MSHAYCSVIDFSIHLFVQSNLLNAALDFHLSFDQLASFAYDFTTSKHTLIYGFKTTLH